MGGGRVFTWGLLSIDGRRLSIYERGLIIDGQCLSIDWLLLSIDARQPRIHGGRLIIN